MKLDDHIAGENVLYLEQGMELIRRLDDDAYSGSTDKLFRGGVGAQLRHCIDFYDCFLRGLAEGRIDYTRRERDPGVETSRETALAALERVRGALLELPGERAAQAVEVRSEEGSPVPGAPCWSASSVGRELQFLVSHTIHHYALIASLLELQGRDVHRDMPEFGVAPSTLSHWRKSGSPAR